MDEHLPVLIRTSSIGSSSREAASVRRGFRAGRLHRVAAGAYLAVDEWSALDDRQQHVLLVRAVLPSLSDRFVLSHLSAVAVSGWPAFTRYPQRVFVTASDAARSQRRSTVTAYSAPLATSQVHVVDGYPVTSAARTCADISCSLPFVEAVATLDHALHVREVTAKGIHRALDERVKEARCVVRGVVAARRAIAVADGRAESVAESLCRIVLNELGAPQPVLQRSFFRDNVLLGRVDFFFEGCGVVLECDGISKYSEPRYLKGRAPAQVFLAERRRQQEIAALPEVTGVVRCDWHDLMKPAQLRRLLIGAGVPVP